MISIHSWYSLGYKTQNLSLIGQFDEELGESERRSEAALVGNEEPLSPPINEYVLPTR